MSKLLSIVTISFNQARYLPALLDSIEAAKTDEVEYIVVDPGSTDGSRKLLESRRHIIDKFVLEPDDGPADGLNRGFAQAEGRFGYFINSDDFLLPGGLNCILAALRESPEPNLLLFSGWHVDEDGRPTREVLPSPAELVTLRHSRTLFQQGVVFPMASFREVGGFNPSNRTCWDYELLHDLLLAESRATRRPERVAAFRLHDVNLAGVGGAAHHGRYLADMDRILGRSGANSQRLRDTSALARHYAERLGLRLRRTLRPGRVEQEWLLDQARGRAA